MIGMLGRLIGFCIVAIFLWFAWFVLAAPGPLGTGVRTDGIVVLTGGPGRVARGIELLQAKSAKRLLISGVDPSVRPVELAVEYKVPKELFDCCVDLGREAVEWQYTHGVPADRLDRIAPETWQLDQAGLDRKGNDAIQLQLFWDYQFNLDGYPGFQEYFRTHQPPLLVTWGRNDQIFGAAGAEAFQRDLPDGEYHLLDTGHFALETHGDEIAGYIRDFLGRKVRQP